MSALCCTYSYANGLFVWPLSLIQLLASAWFSSGKNRQTYWRNAIVWAFFAFAVIAVYLTNYSFKKSFAVSTLLDNARKMPVHYARCLVDGLATSLTGYGDWNLYAGFLLICLGIISVFAFCKRVYIFSKDALAPLSLMLFGIISTALIFLGRAGADIQSVLCSRYASLTNLWIIGFYLFLLSCLKLPLSKPKQILALFPIAALAVLMFGGSVISIQEAMAEGDRLSYIRRIAANELLNYKIEPDEALMDILPFPKWIRIFAPYLEERCYSVFGQQIDGKKRSKNNELVLPDVHFDVAGITFEEVSGWANKIPQVVHYQVAEFSGWTIDYAKPEKCLTRLYVIIDGKQEYQAACRLYRPDVANHFQRHEKSFRYSGFHFTCRPELFGKGKHTISLRSIDDEGQEYISSNLATFSVP
jgi:hypothetical protein